MSISGRKGHRNHLIHFVKSQFIFLQIKSFDQLRTEKCRHTFWPDEFIWNLIIEQISFHQLKEKDYLFCIKFSVILNWPNYLSQSIWNISYVNYNLKTCVRTEYYLYVSFIILFGVSIFVSFCVSWNQQGMCCCCCFFESAIKFNVILFDYIFFFNRPQFMHLATCMTLASSKSSIAHWFSSMQPQWAELSTGSQLIKMKVSHIVIIIVRRNSKYIFPHVNMRLA